MMAVRDSARPTTGPDSAVTGGSPTHAGAQVLAVVRILLGLTFLWAFLDKLLGLGYSTPAARAWVNGGSPTKGFLSNVEVGPLQSVLRAMAGNGVADWLFMVGLLGIGVALVAGIGMRVAAVSGVVLLMAMWVAEWPPAQMTSAGEATASTNPLIDDHLVYAVVLVALALYAAGDTWGFGRSWARSGLVRGHAWLR